MPEFRAGKPRCRLRLLVNTAVPAGWSTVSWGVADYDDVGGWSGGAGYTLDRPGLWAIRARAGFGTAAAAGIALIGLAINGTQIDTGQTAASTTGATASILDDVYELAAGDVVTMLVNRSATATSQIFADRSGLTIVRIGPVRYT